MMKNMSTKKLTPGAKRMNNPQVRPDDANPQVANGDYQVDQRGPADRDGNAEQARTARKAPSPASPPRRSQNDHPRARVSHRGR